MSNGPNQSGSDRDALKSLLKHPFVVTVGGGLLVLLIAALVASGVKGVFGDEKGSEPRASTEGQSTTPDISTPAPDSGGESDSTAEPPTTPTPKPEPAPVFVGLETLREEEDVIFDVHASYENRRIGTEAYENSVTGNLYPDGSGMEPLTVITAGRFSSVHFIVGIDAETVCPKAAANVSIEDQNGVALWGPVEVDIDDPVTESVPIEGTVQIDLVHHSRETEGSCNLGETQVTWGDVTFKQT